MSTGTCDALCDQYAFGKIVHEVIYRHIPQTHKDPALPPSKLAGEFNSQPSNGHRQTPFRMCVCVLGQVTLCMGATRRCVLPSVWARRTTHLDTTAHTKTSSGGKRSQPHTRRGVWEPMLCAPLVSQVVDRGLLRDG